MTTGRSQTQGIEVDAAPDAVIAVLANATRLPEWAPGFADVVMTLPVLGDGDPSAVAAILSEELAALASLLR